MPHDGPETQAFRSDRAAYHLVALDYRTAKLIGGAPPDSFTGLADTSSTAPVDLISEGDVLSVSIFGADGDLFGGKQVAAASALQHLAVDRDGRVPIPFAGEVHVSGLTPDGAAQAIGTALHGVVANPQVVVQDVSNLANSVTVLGEVRNPGRFPLSANDDCMWDVLASAGGPTRPPGDVTVELVRGGRSYAAPLTALMDDAGQNVRLALRDQVRLL